MRVDALVVVVKACLVTKAMGKSLVAVYSRLVDNACHVTKAMGKSLVAVYSRLVDNACHVTMSVLVS